MWTLEISRSSSSIELLPKIFFYIITLFIWIKFVGAIFFIFRFPFYETFYSVLKRFFQIELQFPILNVSITVCTGVCFIVGFFFVRETVCKIYIHLYIFLKKRTHAHFALICLCLFMILILNNILLQYIMFLN